MYNIIIQLATKGRTDFRKDGPREAFLLHNLR